MPSTSISGMHFFKSTSVTQADASRQTSNVFVVPWADVSHLTSNYCRVLVKVLCHKSLFKLLHRATTTRLLSHSDIFSLRRSRHSGDTLNLWLDNSCCFVCSSVQFIHLCRTYLFSSLSSSSCGARCLEDVFGGCASLNRAKERLL